MDTKAQFDEAAQNLLGEVKYSNLIQSGYSRPDFCREIAQDDFIGTLMNPATKQENLELVRRVALRLWQGDGITGLVD